MIGKAYLSMRDQKRAIPYFVDTRKNSQEGYVDSLGLSDESFGWQALAEYEQKDYVSSIQHYLNAMDVNSLNWLCNKVSQTTDGTIEKIVRDKTARNVLLGWAVSRPFWNAMEWGEDETYKDFFSRLLSAIEEIKEKGSVDYADRVAWLYYIKGDMTSANRWLVFSKSLTPLARFVDFKLSLRDGKIDEAIQKLSKVMASFEKSPDKDMFFQEDVNRLLNSDMAVLKLSRKEYLQSFELLLRGKFWEDIAYVAEKVLTAQELEKFLEQNKSSSDLSNRVKWYQGYYLYVRDRVKRHPDEAEFYADSLKDEGPTLYDALSYLLARRYAREGNLDKAILYMPQEVSISRTIKKKSDQGDYLE
ncbi:MAG: hypothetical protein JNJ47_04915, partial [Alphaproteobacteria bacterium]|nr:hypothetical protein [Alphaproteobacteria bacterium]